MQCIIYPTGANFRIWNSIYALTKDIVYAFFEPNTNTATYLTKYDISDPTNYVVYSTFITCTY